MSASFFSTHIQWESCMVVKLAVDNPCKRQVIFKYADSYVKFVKEYFPQFNPKSSSVANIEDKRFGSKVGPGRLQLLLHPFSVKQIEGNT